MRVTRRLSQALALVLTFIVSSSLVYAGPDIDEDDIFRKPAGADKEDKLPMLVFLHQAGGCPAYLNTAFRRLADQWQVCIYLPSGGTKLKADENGFQTYDWRSKDIVHLIAKITQLIKTNNIDPSLIFISGFSAGASMSYLVGIEAPYMCAGIIPFSGPFPRKYVNAEKFKAAKGRYRTFIVHGNLDKTVPVKKVREDCAYLNKQGFKSELYLCDNGHEFPDDWADILSEGMQWCNEQ